MQAPVEAFFLPANDSRSGQRFCLFHPPQGEVARGSVLYIHPFAEEMNKSRRMAALQSHAMALAGFAVLQIDLLGCGDSSGDFGDATWEEWVRDVVLGCRWLQDRSYSAPPEGTPAKALPLWLWGLRAGCLLAVEAANQLDEPYNFLFWQPALAGKPLLQQFLRLKAAGNMLGGHVKGIMEGLRQQLSSGDSVEIAGYMLSAKLAAGLERSLLLPPAGQRQPRRLEWLEISTREDSCLSPASCKTVAQWQQAGCDTRSYIVNGPSFWQTTEVEEVPTLITTTVDALVRVPFIRQAIIGA